MRKPQTPKEVIEEQHKIHMTIILIMGVIILLLVRVYDFKEVVVTHLKKTHTFKITHAKMLEVNKQEPVYSAAPCDHTVLKRGHHWNDVEVQALDDVDCVKVAKKKDVLGLLRSMGPQQPHQLLISP